MMRYLSLFSGIEAATVAWQPLGWECVGVAEIEPFPCAILAHHYPNVPNLGNVSNVTEEQVAALGRIDLIVGGFPCQDLSIAGKRKGLRNEDGSLTRSGLFFDAMDLFGSHAPDADCVGSWSKTSPASTAATAGATLLPWLEKSLGVDLTHRSTAGGTPDDYLDIQYRGKDAADGPKYRALGNSMAVPVMHWIGQRIAAEQARIDAGREKAA